MKVPKFGDKCTFLHFLEYLVYFNVYVFIVELVHIIIAKSISLGDKEA